MATGEGSSRSGFGTFLLIFVPLAILAAVAAVLSPAGGGRPSDVYLSAAVSHGASGFLVSNNDDYDWGNCDLELNGDYQVVGVNVPARQVITVRAGDFATSSGARFNPVTMKPLRLFIYCRSTPHGTRSSLVGWR